MEQPANLRGSGQRGPGSDTGAFEPFPGSYSSDFENMLAAHNAATGQSLSPSASFHENLSPDTMLSESAYGGFDQYSAFGAGDGNEHITPQQFNEMLSLSDASQMNYGGSNLNFGHSVGLEVPQPSQAWVNASSQDAPTSMPSLEAQSADAFPATAQQPGPQHLSPSQGSPAGSSSSRQLISPVVRVESYEEPARSIHLVDGGANFGRQSNNHLSPYGQHEYESDGDQGSAWQRDGSQLPVQAVQRKDDGSWVEAASGQKGLSPQNREDMKDLQVPTLDELEERRHLAEKNAGVADWLARSEVGSEADDDRKDSLAPYHKSAGRRRAKSTNDLGVFNTPDDSLVPGPGVYLNVPSDYEEDEDFSASDELESPPAQVEMQNTDSYFPSLSDDSLTSGHVPWVDPPIRENANQKQYQPPTANAAMMRFKQRAKDIESASLAATLGSSRRRSESDMGSIMTVKGISRDLSAQPKEKSHRMENLLQKITPRRVNSNQRKRKGTIPTGQSQVNVNDGSSGTSTPQELQPTVSGPKRMGSWGKPKSPRLDTSPSIINPPTSNSNTLGVASPSTPWGMAKNVIRRSRSRSELGRSRSKSDTGRSPGLGELMTAFGGPPMPKLASPSGPTQSRLISPSAAIDYDDDSGDEGGMSYGAITMDLAVRTDPVIPTYHGFHAQTRGLNPRIPDYLLERVTKEQLGRFQRLAAAKSKHSADVKAAKCASKPYCFELGGVSQQLKPRVGNKDGETPFQGFQILKPGMSAEGIEKDSGGTIQAAQFPLGVPLPPVDMLPAEFECPLCFKVKKFYKPSDWTKHVHEDVQPFTCTFPTCNEPKSFKRKADWVRHENERHRQLENWTCDIGECVHTCYRKDNFVQHLVREHKIPEPKARTVKGASGSSKSPISPLTSRNWVDPHVAMANPAGYGAEDVWMVVDRCRRDTTKQPQDEPCRFCGNICNSWKKLTVHLAKHMEQISMPILPLIENKQVNAVVGTAPLPLPQLQRSTGALTDSPQDLPTMLPDEPIALDLNDTMSQTSITPGISVNGTQVMHTYPPPQYLNPQYRAPVQPTSFGALPSDTSFSARSYPGPMPNSNQHTPSGHSSYSSSIQGSSQQPPPRSVAGTYQQQVYPSPTQSNGFGDDTLSAMDAAFMLSSGQVSASPSPVPTPQTGGQQNGSLHSGFDQTFTFPSQHYSNYGFGGTSSS